MEDIPKALRREQSKSSKNSSKSGKMLMGGFLIIISGAIALGSVFFLSRDKSDNPVTAQPTPSKVIEPEVTTTPETTSTPSPPDNLLGHLTYEEASVSELQPITPDQKIKLRASAAEKFLQMQADAKKDGIILEPISGYRTFEQQEYLFFNVKEQRAQVTTERAEVSAPPGYSEHHTGYAIDIGDGMVPATHLQVNFEKTPAFLWLKANAPKYSFELSFPRNNPQNISYEPWHWRFVGDTHSLETFYKARNFSSNSTNE